MADLHLMRVFLSLLAVISLLLAALWLLRRLPGARNLYGHFGHGQPVGKRWGSKPLGRRLTLLHTLALGSPRTHLALVRLDREELLLGVTAGQITLLHTLARQDVLVTKAATHTAAELSINPGAEDTPDLPASSPTSHTQASRFANLLAHLRKDSDKTGPAVA